MLSGCVELALLHAPQPLIPISKGLVQSPRGKDLQPTNQSPFLELSDDEIPRK